MDVYQKLIEELAKVSKKQGITRESNLKDIGIDSLDLLSLVVKLEEIFNIEFSDDELASLHTVNDVVTVIERKKK